MWTTGMGIGAGVFWLSAVVLGVILVIAWIMLPLALIGTKPLLRELLAEAKRTNALLEQIRAGQKAS